MNKIVLNLLLFHCILNLPILLSPIYGTEFKTEQTCIDIIEKMNEVVIEGGTVHSEIELRNVTEATVHLTGTKRPGRHGGMQLEIRKTGTTWGSAHREMRFDPQGDPRFFISLVGTEAAKYFGFEMVDGQTMWVPDRVDFNEAVRKIAKAVNERHGLDWNPVLFFEQTKANATMEHYLSAFGREGLIPMSSDSNHFLHDIGFHSSAVFIPKRVLEFQQQLALNYLEFVEHLRINLKPTLKAPQQKALAEFMYSLKAKHVAEIDYLTGSLSDQLSRYFGRKDKKRAVGLYLKISENPDLLEDIDLKVLMARFIGVIGLNLSRPRGRSPEAVMENDVLLLEGISPLFVRTGQNLMEITKVLDPQIILDAFETYSAAKSLRDPNFKLPFHTRIKPLDTWEHEGWGQAIEEICMEVNLLRSYVQQEAILKLAGK